MSNTMEEWRNFKEELGNNIRLTKEQGAVNREVLDIMLDLLEESKVKIKVE